MGQPIVSFRKTGRAAALPAPLVPPALVSVQNTLQYEFFGGEIKFALNFVVNVKS